MKKFLFLFVAISLSLLALTGCDAVSGIIDGILGGSGNSEPGDQNGGQTGTHDSNKCTEGLTFELTEDGNYTVSGYSGSDPEVYIPLTYEEKPVTSIKENAFKNNATITKLNLEKNITVIGAKAFENAACLEKVSFYEEPESFTVNPSAFSGCAVLKKFNLPSTTVRIGARAFAGCNKLQQTIDGLTYVGNWVTLCDLNATSVQINKDTVGIADSAFSGTAISSITIPAKVKYIGTAAFLRCISLTTVAYSNGATLEVIADEAFMECSALADVKIPQTIKSIGTFVFKECPALVSIAIPETCNAYSSYKNALLIDKSTKTLIFGCNVEKCDIPADGSVEHIGDYAFYKNTAYSLPRIPAPVKTIGKYAFASCKTLKYVSIENNSELEVIDDYAFRYAGFSTLTFGTNSKLREIKKGSFEYLHTGISTITIPASLEIIGEGAFAGDWPLISIYFEEGSKLKTISKDAFRGCSYLKDITLPDGVKEIGEGAFFNCHNLVTAYIPASVEIMGKSAFDFEVKPSYAPMNPKIRCAASEKPAGWSEGWYSEKFEEPIWNYTP